MNKPIMKKLILLLLLVVLLSSAFHTIATALTASPVRLELQADPGTTITPTFKLYNDSRTPQTYYLSFRNFESQGESGQPHFTDNNTGLASWAQTEASVSIQALEWKDIQLSITIPKDAEPGGYTAAVFGSTIPPENLGEGQLGLQSDVGTLLLLRVSGDLVQGADILEFNTKNKKRSFSSLPVDFYYRFQNEGESWVKPLGDINIHNMLGRTSKIVPANPNGSNVLSKSIRKLEASWLTSGGEKTQDARAERPPGPPEGFWNKVQHEWKHFAFGRYTADLTLTYNNDTGTTTKAKTTFWVMPWHLITVIGAALLALITIITLVVVFVVMVVLRRKHRK